MKPPLSLVLLANACVLHAQPATSIFHVVTTPNFLSTNDNLEAVSASSPTDIWAVGQSTIHFDGATWTAFGAPHLDGQNDSALLGVADFSPTNAWAVGYINSAPNSTQLLEHWDGTQWSDAPGPQFNAGAQPFLSSISALSADNIWAAGHILTGEGQLLGLIEHYNGTSWTATEIGNPFLTSIAVLSSNNIWVAGWSGAENDNSQTYTAHWNGTKWSTVASPSTGSGANQINGLLALAPNNIWAVGFTTALAPPKEAPTTTLIEHWDGTAWSIVPSPNVGPNSIYQSNRLLGITAVSPTDLWAFGSYFPADGSGQQFTLAMQGNGTTWTIMPAPSPDANGFRGDILFAGTVTASGKIYLVGSQDEAPDPFTGTLVLTNDIAP
jgi:hypothetical protein